MLARTKHPAIRARDQEKCPSSFSWDLVLNSCHPVSVRICIFLWLMSLDSGNETASEHTLQLLGKNENCAFPRPD
jgi:hypothetical protein